MESPIQYNSTSSRCIQQVRRLFLTGNKYTTKEINHLVGFNDARKVISVLRNNEGWDIRDVRMDNGCKLYWLEKDDKQLSLF